MNVNVGVGKCERNKARHKVSAKVRICSEFWIHEYSVSSQRDEGRRGRSEERAEWGEDRVRRERTKADGKAKNSMRILGIRWRRRTILRVNPKIKKKISTKDATKEENSKQWKNAVYARRTKSKGTTWRSLISVRCILKEACPGSWTVYSSLQWMLTKLTKDGRPKTAGDLCSARRVGYRKNESQNSVVGLVNLMLTLMRPYMTRLRRPIPVPSKDHRPITSLSEPGSSTQQPEILHKSSLPRAIKTFPQPIRNLHSPSLTSSPSQTRQPQTRQPHRQKDSRR